MKIKVLSMKAKLVNEVKDETPLAFTRNSLSLWDLVRRVKAVKAKKHDLHVVTRAYARGSKAIGAGENLPQS